MEGELGGGDKLEEANVPGRGEKRPRSPASSPSDDDWEDSTSASDDDDGWEFSEEEEEDEDYRDTATNEAKKSKGLTLKMIMDDMAETVKIHDVRTEYLRQAFSEEQQREATLGDKIRQVQQLARECGVSETGPEWYALYKICKNEKSMESFIGMSTTEERMAFLNRYDGNSARDGDTSGEFRLLVERNDRDGDTSSESSGDELLRLFFEMDDGVPEFVNGMAMFAIHHDTYCNKAKRRRQLTPTSQGRARQAPARELVYMNAFHDQTATSEAKKSKNSSLRMIKDHFADMVKKQAARNEYFKQAFSEMQQRNMQKRKKQQREATRGDKIRQVLQLARECGVSETDPEWIALCKFCKDENGMEFFIGTSTTEGRKAFFNRYVRLNNLI